MLAPVQLQYGSCFMQQSVVSPGVDVDVACMLQVEQYMTDIIFKMRGDLREILHQSVVDYPSKAREKWIFDWPSQIILVVNQIFWCQEVEEAFMNLNKGQSNALKVRI